MCVCVCVCVCEGVWCPFPGPGYVVWPLLLQMKWIWLTQYLCVGRVTDSVCVCVCVFVSCRPIES